ncbi:MAG: YifB family Mg chelatase-like AAA ATPase [Lachnospiraceae bacterium]|nr:YifB family Mg chelatase-like AAA ATPase [Lachnospiraceae bacterium]
MVYKVYSGRVGGIFGDLITVEVDASPGLPGLEMIGLLASEVREAGNRVRVSLKNNGISLPAMKITINLSPADEHKSGSAFDLPIAVAILGVYGHIPDFDPEKTLVIGELSLDGEIRPVRGILPIVKMAREQGFERVILPKDNAAEGALIRGIDIIPVDTLSETMGLLALGGQYFEEAAKPYRESFDPENAETADIPDFSDVIGQENVKRAAKIAASGFHHFLMTGPPGSGKSLIAKRIPGIMPEMSYEECLEITTIYSVAGKLTKDQPFVKRRPFWSPHHGASAQSIVGGGLLAKPGLVSLSHKGILFLDEMPDFKRETIDMLRQPLEDGTITVSRARQSLTYPAGFMLVGAMNPCPCGFFPDRSRCKCTEVQISRYLSRISGPILDRIDICVEVSRMDLNEISAEHGSSETSAEIRKKVEAAVNRQKERYKDENFKFNADLPGAKIAKYVPLGAKETDFVNSLYESMRLSMRSLYKLLRVSRTIADYDGDSDVSVKHLAEAACYRFPDYLGG